MLLKIFLHLFLGYIFFERIQNTFSNAVIYRRDKTKVETLLCTSMVALYIAILLISFSNVYSPDYAFTGWALSGFLLWGLGFFYRRAAIRSMGKNWSIYRVPPSRLKGIITLGSFQYSRHPYYAASILELLSYAIMFKAALGAKLVLFVYLPLILIRALSEEKRLLQLFPTEYAAYKERTPMGFNIQAYLADLKPMNNVRQIIVASKKYGAWHIFRILRMNRAVQRYFRNYMITQCICALSKTGVLDVLMDEGELDIARYAKAKNLNFRILRLLCDYLYVVRILHKHVFNYALTGYGRKLMDDSRGVFDFIYAYAPIFENLDVLIKNEKKYGVDFDRRGEFVGRASAELADLFPFPVARFLLTKFRLARILDLGSGSGDFLIGFCKEPDVSGYGIDLSPEAVSYAQKKSQEAGLAEKARFIVGDIMKLKEFVPSDIQVDVITSMFVLHEFLSISETVVLNIFESIKKAFPDKYILICELTRCSLDRLYKTPSGVAEHHLFHNLSNQGLATSEEWRRLFEKANLELITEERLDLAEQSIFLLKPRQ